MSRKPSLSVVFKHNPFDLLLGEHTGIASAADHLPLKRGKLLFLTLRLLSGHHAAEQVTFDRPLALREAFVLPPQSRTDRESQY